MGEILLEWKDHDKVLSKKLWEFLEEEYLVDFSVTCHGQQKKVHKFVLALLFPIIKESLRSAATSCLDQEAHSSAPSESSTIPQAQGLSLDNIAYHAEDMDYLIQFAYTGKTTVPKEHADCLMRIADAMEVTSLKDCLRKLHNMEIKVADMSQCNDTTPLSRLRPRSQMKKIIDESDDFDDDDLDFDCSLGESADKGLKLKKLSRSKKQNTLSRKTPEAKVIIPAKGQIAENTKSPIETPDNNKDNKPIDDGQAKLIPESDSRDGVDDEEEEEDEDTEEDADRNLKCPHCDYITNHSYRLKTHLKTHYESLTMRYTCKNCKNIFATKAMYTIHIDSKCCECKYCDFKSTHKRNLLQHMMAKHKVDSDGNPLEKNVKCPECDFMCFAKHQLQCHILTKHKHNNKFKCKECNYTAPYMHTLTKHFRIMHQHMRDYMCEECGFQSQTSSGLSRHVMLKHKGIKPHKCDVCGAEYSDTLRFKLHQQKHTGGAVRNYVCHICGQGFFRRDHLRVHCRCKHKVELPPAKPNYEFSKNTPNEMESRISANTIEADEGAVQDSLNYLMNN